MYEIDVVRYSIKKGEVEQEFTIEDYKYEYELFLSDYIDYIGNELVTKVTMVMYHNRNVEIVNVNLSDYSVQRG